VVLKSPVEQKRKKTIPVQPVEHNPGGSVGMIQTNRLAKHPTNERFSILWFLAGGK
jgi:hypothetical protein